MYPASILKRFTAFCRKEKTLKYLVTEVQTWSTGSVQTPTYAYDNENSALAKYHTILAAAAVSSLPVHACMLYTNEGNLLRSECFKHEVTE